MAYDPLSRSTRVARMTFMIVGASSVAASAFDIQLKEIESLRIPFPDQTMTIALGVATTYLFIAFLIAYIDDIRHREPPYALQLESDRREQRLKKLGQLQELLTLETWERPKTDQMMAQFSGLLDDLNLTERLDKYRSSDGHYQQRHWEKLSADAKDRVHMEVRIVQMQLSSQSFDWFSSLRLYAIDGFVPCLVFFVAVAGWLGWLDSVVLLLDVGADATSQ